MKKRKGYERKRNDLLDRAGPAEAGPAWKVLRPDGKIAARASTYGECVDIVRKLEGEKKDE